MRIYIAVISCFIIAFACRQPQPDDKDYSGWKTYAGTKDGSRYSSNEQFDKQNVSRLTIAWRYSTHDKDTGNRSQNQCNPIVVDGVLYGTSPRLKLFALDAATGKQRWIFDPANEDSPTAKDPNAFFKVSRGVMYWQDKEGKEKRIFYGVGSRTYSIDAVSGQPVRSFGKRGYIDLSENLDREGPFNPFIAATTPGIIFNDLMILGSRLAESADA